MFLNTKRMNLKVLVSTVLDLWKRFRMSFGHEFIGKKKQGHQGLSVRILENGKAELEMDARQTVNGLKCWILIWLHRLKFP